MVPSLYQLGRIRKGGKTYVSLPLIIPICYQPVEEPLPPSRQDAQGQLGKPALMVPLGPLSSGSADTH